MYSYKERQQRILGLVLLVLALCGLTFCVVQSARSPDTPEFAGQLIVASAQPARVSYERSGGTKQELPAMACPSGTKQGAVCGTLPQVTGLITLYVDPIVSVAQQAPIGDMTPVVRNLNLIPRYMALLAGAAAFLLALAIPWVFFPSEEGAWTHLFTENAGGFSLARFQLALWFGAALVGYTGLGVPRLNFVYDAPPTVWALLGISSATALLSMGANQNVTGTARATLRETSPDAKEVLNKLLTQARKGMQQLPPEVVEDISHADGLVSDFRAGKATLPQVGEAFWKAHAGLDDMLKRQPAGAAEAQKLLDQVAVSTHLFAEPPEPLSAAEVNDLADTVSDRLTRVVDQVRRQGYVDDLTTQVVQQAYKAMDRAATGSISPREYRAKVQGAVSHLTAIVQPRSGMPIDLTKRIAELSDRLNQIGSRGPIGMVQNANGEGDMTRYQHLVVTIIAVFLFLTALFRTLLFPDIPVPFLEIIGLSQATYVASKYWQRLKSAVPQSVR